MKIGGKELETRPSASEPQRRASDTRESTAASSICWWADSFQLPTESWSAPHKRKPEL